MGRTASRRSDAEKNLVVVGGEPTAPDSEEWEDMVPCPSFVLRSVDGSEHEFEIDNDVIIVPHGIEPEDEHIDLHDYWVGKIQDIRMREDSPLSQPDMWTLIEWYWSPDDVKDTMSQFKPERYGKLERFLSNHQDIVHSTCIQDFAKVLHYDEKSLQPPLIDSETFYCRRQYDFLRRRLRPDVYITCTCRKMYNPDDGQVMHFCPRLGCMRWFHVSCLDERGFKDITLDQEARRLRLQCSIPGTAGRIFRDKINDEAREHMWSKLPQEILTISASPIVKGHEIHGVAGNIASVLAAREILYGVLVEHRYPPEDWKQAVKLRLWRKTWRTSVRDQRVICPSCKEPI